MDNSRSSYEFHRGIETLSAFWGREWRAIGVFGAGFSILMVVAVLLLDPAFFYPRLQTDPLNYWLKAKSLVEHGTTAARWAINAEPFSYAAMPGVLRAPVLLAFRDFDHQLRVIQLLNIPLVAGVALLSAYVASWSQPVERHPWVIAFSFAFTALSPVWINNVLLPLVDAPYALVTLGAIILSVRLIADDRSPRNRVPAIAALAALFTLAFLLRYTAPVLIVFAATLIHGRSAVAGISRARVASILLAAIGLVAVLVTLNSDAIFGRYFREPFFFLRNATATGITLNLFGAAIPAQIVPNFIQGFVVPPVGELYKTNFFSTAGDTGWLALGLSLSAITLTGMWKARTRFLPEILYLLAPLPVIAVMLPSTARYLMTYQAFVWIFFITGAAALYRIFTPRLPGFIRTRAFAGFAVLAAIAMVVGIRTWRFAGTATEKMFAVGIARAPDYVADVSVTFRGLRAYIETLPPGRALLVSERGSVGRWTAIADRHYYLPDSAMHRVVDEKDVYLVLECGTLEGCQRWDWWRSRIEERIAVHGPFAYDRVFSIRRPRARAEVFRVRNSM